jgi:hypothetical protein
MKVRTWLGIAACGAGLLLSGCGVGSPTPVVPAVSPLTGNWLIVGSMPTNQFPLPAGSGLGLAVTFDVAGNQIAASGLANGPCMPTGSSPILGSSFSYGFVGTGTVAADGSFTVQSSATISTASVSIQGKIPQANANQFAGSYTASFASPTGSGCVGNFGGMFTAASFPLVNGVYAGTGSTQTVTNGVSTTTPVTVQVSLKQGGTMTNPATGVSTPSIIALTGSIRVQGSSCFTSGVMNLVPSSRVQGNNVLATFTMDDGSTVSLLGQLTDLTGTHLSTGTLFVPEGKCGPVPYLFILPGLDWQGPAN